MTDEAVRDSTLDGWDFVMRQGAMLALLPIEDWLSAFDRAEALGPILDPTLYREYLFSGKGEIIKDVLHHALLFKRAIQRAQAAVEAKGAKP